jgi:hypothetical protein
MISFRNLSDIRMRGKPLGEKVCRIPWPGTWSAKPPGWLGATAVKSGGVRYIRRPVAARSSEAKVAKTFRDPGLRYKTQILGEFRDP